MYLQLAFTASVQAYIPGAGMVWHSKAWLVLPRSPVTAALAPFLPGTTEDFREGPEMENMH